jgi:hypothetical protein
VPPGAYPVAAERSLGLLASAWEGFTFWVAHAGRFLTMSVLLGSLGFINSWDLPTFLGLVCFAAGVRNYLSEGRLTMSVVGRTLGFTCASRSYLRPVPDRSLDSTRRVDPSISSPHRGWPRPLETMATRPHHFAYLWATILWPTLTFAVVALGPWKLNRSILRWALLPAFVPFLAWLFLVTASHGPWASSTRSTFAAPGGSLVFLLAAVTVPALAALSAGARKDNEARGDENLAFIWSWAGSYPYPT